MYTEVIAQRYFKDSDGKARCIDIMPMNKDTWESEIPEDWHPISEKEADKIANPPLTHEQHVAIAESQKQALIAEASQKTQLWQTQLMLGIITEEDKASLKEWMLYVQDVQAVDPSLGAGLVWPTPPVSPAR